MPRLIIHPAGGGGSGSSDCTGLRQYFLANHGTIISVDSGDVPVEGSLPESAVLQSSGGSIPTMNDSGNVSIGVNGGKSYSAGYYPNAHGAVQGVGAGSIIDSAGGNIPTKNDSGDVSLGVGQSKSYPAGYYPNAHGAAQGIGAGSVIDSAGGNIPTRSGLSKSGGTVSGQAGYYPTAPSATVTADDVTSGYAYFSSSEGDQDQDVTQYKRVYIYGVGSGYVGSGITRQAAKTVTPSTSAQTAVSSGVYTTGAITVGAIPNQAYGGDVKLTSANTYSNFAASQWALSRHYVYVDVYNGEWG